MLVVTELPDIVPLQRHFDMTFSFVRSFGDWDLNSVSL